VPLLAEQPPPEPALALMSALGLAGLIVWVAVAMRVHRREPVVPREPRRPARWGPPELLMILLVFLVLQLGVFLAARAVLGAEAVEPPKTYYVEKANTEHVVSRLLERARTDPTIFLLCGFAAVVAAPIAEEFFYRLLLQGWLERLWHDWEPKMPLLRRVLPGAAVPVVLVAVAFARAHFRVPAAPHDPRYYLFMMVGFSTASLLTVVAAIVLLRIRVGATAADLGWDFRKLPADAALGVLAFLLIAAPMYALQASLGGALPAYLSPDPFTLFPFALLLGFLYYRTHRLAPSIVLHFSLNATTLLLAWLAMSGRPAEPVEPPVPPACEASVSARKTDSQSVPTAWRTERLNDFARSW